MSEDQKRMLEAQLWGIANLLRGKISADDYRDYILGVSFYKYLSEKLYLYANKLLEKENVTDYLDVTDQETLKAIEENAVLQRGYFLFPAELFSKHAKRGSTDPEDSEGNILDKRFEAVVANPPFSAH